METCQETVLLPTFPQYSPNNIYTGDKTALFYKSLPYRTYWFDDKPTGSAKCKDRLTLLIITNMDGSNHRKFLVISKSKTSHCLHKKYKMQVKDMAVDWYISKNAWMTGEIHHQIITKLNKEMRLSNWHILFVTMRPATKCKSTPISSSSCYPIMPPQLYSHYTRVSLSQWRGGTRRNWLRDTSPVLKITKMPIPFWKLLVLYKQQIWLLHLGEKCLQPSSRTVFAKHAVDPATEMIMIGSLWSPWSPQH